MSLFSRRERTIEGYRLALNDAAERGVRQGVERELCKTDLFYLLSAVLNGPNMNHDWLFERCREVQANPDGYIDLWAREHYKSTIITYGLTIQDILNDPEITVGIFSFNRPIAKQFLRQIKLEFESNERLRALFPDIIWENPQRDAPKWSEDEGIVVRRQGNPREATVEAWGVIDAQPTSKHFKLMVYDDIVTRDTVTEGMLPKALSAWEASRNLTSEGGATRYIGTPWHFADTYVTIIERGAAIPRKHPGTRDGKIESEPVLWSRETLVAKRREMGPYTFGAQILLDPTADRNQGFLEAWLRYYEGTVDGTGMNKYILVDPANSKQKKSDYTAMAVIGLSADDNYYLLDMVRDRLNLPERSAALFSLHRRWRPRGVGYEEYGYAADIGYHQEKMGHENYRFDITRFNNKVAKLERIRRMAGVFSAERFWLPHSLIKTDYEGRQRDLVSSFIREEYHPFPVAQHDDMFDAIARIRDENLHAIWPKLTREPDRYSRGPARRRITSAWAA